MHLRRIGLHRLAAVTLMLALSTAACGQKFNKVPDADVDKTQKATAEKFATDTLSAWAKDTYPKISIPADSTFKSAQDDEAKQKESDKAIEASMGDFQSLVFVEAHKSEPPKLLVYRFKGTFSKSQAPAEVRVVFDTTGNLAGFWIKPWKDALS